MFEHLTDLSFQRSRKQAVGFYLVWLLAGSILTIVALEIYRRAMGLHIVKGEGVAGIRNMIMELMPVAVRVVFVISTLLAALIARAKKAYNAKATLCIVLAALLSLTGAFLAFIPVAYLTTLPKKV